MNHSRSTLLCCIALCGALLAPVSMTWAAPPREAAAIMHEFTLLVGIAPRGDAESSEAYRSRREKTQDEVLRRLLRRYNTIEARDLKGVQRGAAGKLHMSMRARRSPGFMHAVALGEGRVTIRQTRHQDELWLAYADPSSEAAASLPSGVRIVDTPEHGLVLESEDPASLGKFTSQFSEFAPQIVLSNSALYMVRGPDTNTWRTLWLAEPKLDTASIARVTLEQGSHTGATFGQLHLSKEGVTRWHTVTEEADRALVFVLDDEPIAVVHRPDSSTVLAARSEKTRTLPFSCDAIWVGSAGDLDECTTLASARASAFIPLKIVLDQAAEAP